MIGLCLVAVFALAAITAGSASAKTPEWGKCEKQAGGKYLDGNCQTKGKGGEYEWHKGKSLAPIPFSGHNVGSGGVLTSALNECEGGAANQKRVSRSKCVEEGGTVFESEEGTYVAVECEGETNTGVAEGKNKISNVHVTFTGCGIFGTIACNSAGAAEEEIRTNELKGELGYINAGAKEVGVKLEPAVKHGHFAEFFCPFLEVGTVVGVGNKKEGANYSPENKGGNDQVISPITPVNEMTSEYTQVYTVNYATVENVPSKFEGKPISLLEDYLYNNSGFSAMWSRAAEEITAVNTPEQPGEIKA